MEVEAGAIRFIESAGPLTKIGTDLDLQCYVDYAGDTASQFFAGWACGTFLAVGGGASSVTYGSDPPAGSGASDEPFVAERLDAPTGTGTPADPYVTRSEVLAGDTGLRLLQRDSYVVGEHSYRTDVTVVNESTTPQEVTLYRAADCYLQNSDRGFGRFDSATGAVSCVASSGRIEQWYPLTTGSHHVELDYGGVWRLVGEGVEFPDTDLGAQEVDNGAGLSWRLQLAPGERTTVSHLTVFSPLGIAPVSASATAAPPTVGSGGTVAYTVTIQNPNVDAVTLDALSVTLPPGFAIVPGSTTGLTSADPSGATWTGPLVARPGTSTLSVRCGRRRQCRHVYHRRRRIVRGHDRRRGRLSRARHGDRGGGAPDAGKHGDQRQWWHRGSDRVHVVGGWSDPDLGCWWCEFGCERRELHAVGDDVGGVHGWFVELLWWRLHRS